MRHNDPSSHQYIRMDWTITPHVECIRSHARDYFDSQLLEVIHLSHVALTLPHPVFTRIQERALRCESESRVPSELGYRSSGFTATGTS